MNIKDKAFKISRHAGGLAGLLALTQFLILIFGGLGTLGLTARQVVFLLYLCSPLPAMLNNELSLFPSFTIYSFLLYLALTYIYSLGIIIVIKLIAASVIRVRRLRRTN